MRTAILALAATTLLARGARAAPTPATDADTKAAHGVVTRWVDAQNHGDWKAYEALYAPAFTGVKRVGTTTKKLDRAGWMKDRKVMFKAKMAVSATGLTVTTDGTAYVVELDQRWEQGIYADQGKKRIVIGRADLLITSEEMLTSRVLLTAAACAKAMFPTGKKGRIGPDRDDDPILDTSVIDLGGDRFVCRVDHAARDATDTTVEIAAIGRAKGWTVLGQVNESTSSVTEPGGTAGHKHEVALSPLVLTASVTAVILTVSDADYDDMVSNRKETVTLYLVGAKGLEQQLELVSTTSSDAEDTRGTTCELVVKDKRHKGYPDLDQTCTSSHGDWWNEDVSQRGIKEETEVTRYVWDGSTYVEK